MIQLNQLNQEETQVLKKLQEIVPNIPKDCNIDNLDIIEKVIQYIMDLQNELEEEPNNQLSHSSSLIRECNQLFNSNLESKTI